MALVRMSATACAVLAIVGLGLLAVFAVDWLFRLGVAERLMAMLLVACGCAWGYFRWARPRMLRASSELEAALFVEREHEIDSDLVAALQFAQVVSQPPASGRLASAVVQYVAEAAPEINVFQGVSTRPLVQRCLAMLVVTALLVALTVVLPAHVAAFGQRLLLSSQPYPSRTHIEQFVIGTNVVWDSASGHAELSAAQAAEGQPLVFRVVCSGVAPRLAAVQLRPAGKWSAGTRIELRPDSVSANGNRGRAVFTGQLPRCVEPATFVLTVGDAPVLRGEIEMIPLPIVELQQTIQPPAYAAAHATAHNPPTSNSAVIEGSSLQIAVRSTNSKPLKSVTLTMAGMGVERITCLPQDDARLDWTSPANLSALSNIRRELRYEVHVIDDDGLSPQLPLRGVVRVRPDELPLAAIDLVHRVVLPSAQPQVTFRAGDDFGISGLELVVDIERARDAEPATENAESLEAQHSPAQASAPAVVDQHRYALPLVDPPLPNERLPLTGSYALDLKPLELRPGDRLKLTVAAADYRGDSEPATAVSDARILEVADEKTVLAAIREADERSESQLNELIRHELSIGKQP